MMDGDSDGMKLGESFYFLPQNASTMDFREDSLHTQ